MPRLQTIGPSALAGGLGGAAAWAFVLSLGTAFGPGLTTELILGALAGLFIGGFLWSREALTGRQLRTALTRAGYGAAAGVLGGGAGAVLGTTVFTQLGRLAADLGGFQASLGIAAAAALGWAVLGSAVGASGGLMIRSRERTVYGLLGGALGGLVGGVVLNALSETSVWSALAGLFLVGCSIGGFISLVEEALVAAKVRVIKGRHVGREFPILKPVNVIGRDDRSDVCLSGAEGVGMQHAYLKRKNGSFSIEQTGEGTGLYINHQKTARSRLADGDIIRVGSVLLIFNAARKVAAAVVIGFYILFGAHLLMAAPDRGLEANRAAYQAQITQFDLSAFPVVKAYVSVLDKNGKDVPGLAAYDFSLLENRIPRPVSGVRKGGLAGTPETLSIALVIDRSGSMAGEKIAKAKDSVLRFLALMERGDKAALFAFSDDVTEVVPLTAEGEKLKSAALSVSPGGHTALYDAVARGVESVKGVAGRRAVIVLTDGIANRGSMSIDQAIDFAAKRNVSVYVIGLGGDVRTARLERIAKETGGTYFFTPAADGLAAIYETISRRIRNEYVVTYETDRRGEYLRTVALEVGKERAERAYFQPGSSLFGSGGGVPGWAFAIPFACFAGFIALSFRTIERAYGTGHLSVVRGRASKKEIDLPDAATLGRDERNTIGLFQDARIEQYHAEIRRENGGYAVVDRGTSAGTLVNQKKIAGSQALADGDIITIGSAMIVFSQGERKACGGCGAPLTSRAKFCPKCGTKQL